MKYVKTMMTYTNNNNEVYYDFNTLSAILHAHPSYLKRVIKQYGFSKEGYTKYNNRYLYRQEAVIDFIVFLVTDKTKTGADIDSGAGI